MTEYSCELGGHPWRYFDSEAVVDLYGRKIYGTSVGGKVYKIRMCPVCKIKECESIEWKELK